MTTVVTGATGQLGRLVVEELLTRGVQPADIVATGRDIEKIKDLADRGVTVRHADFADPDELAAAFAGAERLLLVSTATIGERVADHQRAIDAAKAAGVSQLVYTSAPHADTTQMELAQEHWKTEQYLRASGVPFTVLRNGWYLENYTGQLPTYLQQGSIVGSAGDGRVSAATRADFAAATAVVLTTDGHIGATYELGGDQAFTLGELAALISAAAGTEVRYVDLPLAEYTELLASAGLPAPLAAVIAGSDAALARGELLSDSGDLSRLIGRPTTAPEQAIAAALA